jgi:hypothetical protein
MKIERPNIESAGKKKARPLGRAGLGAGVSNAPLGGHPYTCDLAAAREAVVEMHMVMSPGAHDEGKASRASGQSQLSAELGRLADGGMA